MVWTVLRYRFLNYLPPHFWPRLVRYMNGRRGLKSKSRVLGRIFNEKETHPSWFYVSEQNNSSKKKKFVFLVDLVFPEEIVSHHKYKVWWELDSNK